jgi:hypothetical protein
VNDAATHITDHATGAAKYFHKLKNAENLKNLFIAL